MFSVAKEHAYEHEAASQDVSHCGGICPAVMDPFESHVLGPAVSALQEGLWDVCSISDAQKLRKL